MRLEFEPNSSALPFVENEVVNQNVSSEVEKMLREGVRAAQEGKRAEARNLLLRVTEVDADSENAWLWLASISEYPEELLVFLNNVLRVNQQNERALEWHKATRSLLAKTLVQRGIDAAGDNRRDFARQCFEQALEHESENEMAWLWLASVADSEDEKTAYFERVLSINPANETALFSLKAIETQKTQILFQSALSAAFDGRHADARQLLAEVFSRDAEMEDAWVLKSHLAESFEERAECFLKLRVLNPENEMARASLASWRMLSEKRAAPSKAPEASEFAAEQIEVSQVEASNEAAGEVVAAEFETPAVDETFAVSQAEQTVSAENDAHEAVYFAETIAAEEAADEEAMPADAPTQELRFDSSDAPAADAESSYEEFHAEEVRFEPGENVSAASELSASSADLKTALEAEEAEMNWAFSYSKANKEAEEYFRRLDEADEDIHKTQQANYSEEDFLPDADGEVRFESVENLVQANVETVYEPPTGEWNDASASVFVNDISHAPAENPFESSAVRLNAEDQAAEMPAAEMPAEVYFEADQSAPSMSTENDASYEVAEVTFSEYAAEAVTEQAAAEVAAPVSTSAEQTMPPATEEKPAPKSETVLCPFCDAVNEKQAFSCSECQTVLTLSDLEMLLGAQPADEEKLRRTVESLERENESYGLNIEQMTNLGVGHVNLKNYRQGFTCLQEAVRMNPSNVLLDAQVNALAIRLSEIEEQQTAHDAMAKNRKILVVDDSPTVRKLISGKLEKCGHEVVCAVDGVDALEKINELVPDLVLLDITMPRMDGYQVCKLIRNNETTKDVPVVMISGKDGFFDKVRGRMAGTSGYITKPFGPETLMKTVETYLN